jgi:hypothetical protein
LKDQAARIADATEATGHSPTLLQRLAQIEGMLNDVNRKIANGQIPKREPTDGEIREFVRKKLLDLPALLRDNVARAKRELIEHVKDIVLTPIENMTRYAISGN